MLILCRADFASCVLLLTLSWRTSSGVPVRTLDTEKCESCSLLFKSLLKNIRELLDNASTMVACSCDFSLRLPLCHTLLHRSSLIINSRLLFSRMSCVLASPLIKWCWGAELRRWRPAHPPWLRWQWFISQRYKWWIIKLLLRVKSRLTLNSSREMIMISLKKNPREDAVVFFGGFLFFGHIYGNSL